MLGSSILVAADFSDNRIKLTILHALRESLSVMLLSSRWSVTMWLWLT